ALPAAGQERPDLSAAAQSLVGYALVPSDLPAGVRLTSAIVEVSNEAVAASDPNDADQVYQFGRFTEIAQRMTRAGGSGNIAAGLALFRDGDGAWSSALAMDFGSFAEVDQTQLGSTIGERSILYHFVRGIAPNRVEGYMLVAQRDRVQIAVSVVAPLGAASVDEILPIAQALDAKVTAAPPGPITDDQRAALEEPTPAVLVRGAVRLLGEEFYQPLETDQLLAEAWEGAARALARSGVAEIPAAPAYPADDEAAIALHMRSFPELERLAEGRLSQQELAYAALAELVDRRNDCHTSHLTRGRWQIFQARERGAPAVQIGVSFSLEKPMMVVSVLPNSPAERSGLRSGQEVTAINGAAVDQFSITEARALIDPREGVPTTFTVRNPDGSVRDIAVAPESFALPAIESQILPGNIGLMTFYTFQTNDEQLKRMREILTGWEARGVTGWIIDLRRNSGGSLALMTSMASLFVDGGRLYANVSRDSEPRYVRGTSGLTLPFQRPLVFLVGPGSASASEILSGSLQARGRAVLVGDVTAGCIGSFIPRGLLDGSAFNPTVSEILIGPDGLQLHRIGVTPNVFAPVTAEDAAAGHDPGIPVAVKVIHEITGEPLPVADVPAQSTKQRAIVVEF
ncbi:MAG: S41 family peptidase, partial [Dehalococcoidia bacterium]